MNMGVGMIAAAIVGLALHCALPAQGARVQSQSMSHTEKTTFDEVADDACKHQFLKWLVGNDACKNHRKNAIGSLIDFASMLNPMSWVEIFHNVMEIDPDLEDAEDADAMGLKEELRHAGESCWRQCGKKAGYCKWCGVGNVCCRQDGVDSFKDECRIVDEALYTRRYHHQCVSAAATEDNIPVGSQVVKLDGEALLENLMSLSPELLAEVWLQRAKHSEASVGDLSSFLATEIPTRLGGSPMKGLRLKTLAFLGALQETASLSDEEKESLALLATDLERGWTQAHGQSEDDLASLLSESPGEEQEHPVRTVAETDGKTLAVRSRTEMFDDPYWRTELLEAVWPHEDHFNGYMIRTAAAKVGYKGGVDGAAPTIEGHTLRRNEQTLATASGAYSDKPIVVWKELSQELMQKIWEKAADMFRELDGIDPDEEYNVGFTFRGMKAGGLLSRSGAGLPGPIWHKDTFSDYVAIVYPFCFLSGYNNELASKEVYEVGDPGSLHLGSYRGDLEDTVLVDTIPGNAKQGFGEAVAFNNQETRHRARPPMDAQAQDVLDSIVAARNWGVPSNAVRAMIHISLRKSSPNDIANHLDKGPTRLLTRFMKTDLVNCFKQMPAVQQRWFNKIGGFVDKDKKPPTCDKDEKP